MTLLAAAVLSVAACQTSASVAPSPPASVLPAEATGAGPGAPQALELPSQAVELPAGRYGNSELEPRITFEVAEGWSSAARGPGYLEIRRTPGGFDALALRVFRPAAVYGPAMEPVEATGAAAILSALRGHEVLDVIGESPSRMDGVEGTVLELEYPGPADAMVPVFDVPGRPDDPLYVAPERRLWLALFDTSAGVVAILFEGSAETWEQDLAVVEPVLESVTIGR